MKISLIGTGRVASYLFPKLWKAGIEVHQVVATDINKARNLTHGTSAQALVDIDLLKNNVDLVLICVQDDFIAHVSSQIPALDSTASGSASRSPELFPRTWSTLR